jgi:hypothetical protein
MGRFTGWLALAAVMLTGCAVEGVDRDVIALVGTNGQDLNGQDLNGQDLNGQDLNGQDLNGQDLNGSLLGTAVKLVRTDGAYLGSSRLDGVWLEGSELVALQRGRVLRGAQLTGAVFRARSNLDRPLPVRISDVAPPDEGDDVWRYWVEAGVSSGWHPLCNDPIGQLPAIALEGYWDYRRGIPGGGAKRHDPDAFTLACPVTGAIGKCVQAGYKPWAEVDGISLDAHHQACVRLMRADYCGNGRSYTSDGTLINLYDGLGIQIDTDDWLVEAEWDARGARCLSVHLRGLEGVACGERLVREDCGDVESFTRGTLLISEAPPH